jgi:hypothetical protein
LREENGVFPHSIMQGEPETPASFRSEILLQFKVEKFD